MHKSDVQRRPLRISFVTETYPPEVNGVAATLQRLIQGMQRRGHAVELVRPRQPDERGESDGITTVLTPGFPVPGYAELRMGLPAARPLTRRWRAAPPDVIYVATEGPLGWSAVRAAEASGVPAVSGFHTNFHSYTRHYGYGVLNRVIYNYLRSLHNRTRCTLVPTEELQQALSPDFCNVQVLGRGVDSQLFHPARRSEELRRRWGAGPEDRVVLYVGRLAAEKNLPLALQTFRAMHALDPRLKFVLVGSGPMYQEMFRPYEGIQFVGALTGESLAAHYASGDIFLFPSETETFGNVTQEAMAAGLAVVAYDYAAARLLIRHGENGLLAPLGDAAAFEACALRLVREPALLAPMRAAARRAAESRDWQAVLDHFEQLLFQCTRGGSHVQSTGRCAPAHG